MSSSTMCLPAVVSHNLVERALNLPPAVIGSVSSVASGDAIGRS